jgi:hypothetical protein
VLVGGGGGGGGGYTPHTPGHYDPESDEQALKVRNVLGPDAPNVNGGTAEKQTMENTKDSDSSLFDFDVPDEVLANIAMPNVEVKQSEKLASTSLSGCVFNNCSINFGRII